MIKWSYFYLIKTYANAKSLVFTQVSIQYLKLKSDKIFFVFKIKVLLNRLEKWKMKTKIYRKIQE